MRFLFILSLLYNGCSGGGADFNSTKPSTDPTEVGPDGLLTIDTRTGSRKHLLNFKTSGKHEFGRYLSEYVLVIKSSSESCVRLKVRPAEEIGTPVKKDYFKNDDPGAASCGAGGGGGEEHGANLALLPDIPENVHAPQVIALPMSDAHRNYLDTIPTDTGRLGITSSPELCSISIFRMPAKRISRGPGDTEGSEYTISKTGRLLVVSEEKRVRIWVDEEYGNPCTAVGQVSGDFDAINFTEQSLPVTDRLYMAHLRNLAAETEKAYTRLSDAFGEVSDVDDNGSVDLFLSPDMNRSHFNGMPSDRIDSFRATLTYRPNDLAPFDSQRNSTSNEGEIIYLWVPDPAGIYTYGFLASANSLASNYSKGYVAAQLMNLIMLNHKTIVEDRLKKEKHWLMEALALLAASYVSGNNFVFHQLAQYLTSRPQTINLFAKPASSYENIISDEERQGMLTMFAWYMHTRLCGNEVKICAKLKSLVDTELTGKENIENTFDVGIDQLLLDFGISVAAHLADDPAVVRNLWDKEDSGTEGISKPLEMPLFDDNNLNATEISRDDPPLTVELANDGQTFLSGDSSRPSASAWDRTHASPFPNLSNTLYQVVLPDSDMDLKLVANSVTYVLVTGLTATSTDIVANFGKGLQVVIMPLGERDSNLRKVHQEKVSELGHMDVRTVNLTDTTDPTQTYYNDPPYPQDTMQEWTLLEDKELWIAGSIDNIALNPMTVGDADAYNIKVDPCANTSCSATDEFYLLVQTKVRDFPSQLVPFTLATTTDLSIFKGRNIWAKLEDLDADNVQAAGDAVLCQATRTSPGRCANGRISGAATFDSSHQNSGGYDLPIDNFLFASRPFSEAMRFNNGVLSCTERSGFRSFCPDEAARQFFNFKWNPEAEAHAFVFYTADEDANFSSSLEALGSEDIENLQKFKRLLPNAPFNDDDEDGLEACGAIGLDEENDCRKKNSGQLRAAAQEILKTKRFVCNHDDVGVDCGTIYSDIGSWFPSGQFVNLKKSQQTWNTYYDPAFAKGARGPCVGEQQTSPPTGFPCSLDAEMQTDDIRYQLNVDADRILPTGEVTHCDGTFGEDFDVCIDPVTIHSATGNNALLYTYLYDSPATTRVRERCPFHLAHSRGEVIGKSDRLHYIWFKIKKDAPTFVNLMVGGLNNSQGRYLLRTKIFKHNMNKCQ